MSNCVTNQCPLYVSLMADDEFFILIENALKGDKTALNTILVQAAEFDKSAASTKDSDAMFNRAWIYLKGIGEDEGKPNYSEAAKLFERAMALGHSDAMVNRATMYADGVGELNDEPNYSEAGRLLEDAIALGNSHAMFSRAMMYERWSSDPNGEPNYPKAAELYEDAIELGHSGAMFNRAEMYRHGSGDPNGEPNYPKAAELYRKAYELTKNGDDNLSSMATRSGDTVAKYHSAVITGNKKKQLQGLFEKNLTSTIELILADLQHPTKPKRLPRNSPMLQHGLNQQPTESLRRSNRLPNKTSRRLLRHPRKTNPLLRSRHRRHI